MKEENILIVSPSESFSRQIQHVMKDMGYHFPILHTSGVNYFEEIQRFLAKNDVYAVITRGYNVHLLREKLPIPIVDVRYTFEDVYQSYQHACTISDKVAFISTDIVHDKAKTFQTITNANMVIPEISTLVDIPEKVAELAHSGIEVFIGGRATEEAAARLGLSSVDIFVEEGSLRIALNEAIHFVQLDKEKKKNQSFISAILETTENGMIAFTKDLQINYINQKAKNYFEDSLDSFVQTTLVELIEEIDESTYSLINQLVTINHQNFILNIHPIMIQAETTGFLASFEKLDELQVREGDVRTKLSVKINTARKTFSDLIGSSSQLQQTVKMAQKIRENRIGHADQW